MTAPEQRQLDRVFLPISGRLSGPGMYNTVIPAAAVYSPGYILGALDHPRRV